MTKKESNIEKSNKKRLKFKSILIIACILIFISSLYCLTIDATKSKKETLKFNVDTYKYTDGKLIVNNTQINNVKDFSYYNNTLTVHIVENSDLAILCALSTLFSGAILLLTIIFSTLDAWYNDESFWFIDNE